MNVFDYSPMQLVALSLVVAMILGITARLHHLFPFKDDDLGWLVLIPIIGGFMFIVGILMGKIIVATIGAVLALMIWIIGEGTHATRWDQ